MYSYNIVNRVVGGMYTFGSSLFQYAISTKKETFVVMSRMCDETCFNFVSFISCCVVLSTFASEFDTL